MTELVAFDIFILGLKESSTGALSQLVDHVSQLTGRKPEDLHAALRRSDQPLFAGISLDRARTVMDTLDRTGALVEIRPVMSPLSDGASSQLTECPRCHFEVPGNTVECPKCGLVFAKWEREQIRKMQREQQLEEALTKSLQVRQEWDQRAKTYLEGHPFPEGAEEPFLKRMFQEEIPFQRLESEEGPILMTSRRMLALQAGGVILSIPYEMISDVDVGGGLVKKKDRINMKLSFHGPIVIEEKPATSVNFTLDKESSFYKDVVMDWAFARNFICGSCGARELDFRLDGTAPHCRCMRCATDHEIDLNEAVAIPILHD